MAGRDDVDKFEDDEFEEERPRGKRRRDGDRPPPKSGGLGTGAIVAIVLGVLGVVGVCGCGVLAGLLLPAVQKVREASGRMQSQNNMKQVVLGMFSDSDVNRGFAAPAVPTNPNLSFRVGLLPYIEQDGLYKQMDLAQAWDSVRNKPVTGTTVPQFSDPTNPFAVGGLTPYRVFVGPKALFDGSSQRVPLSSVMDGTSNTILFVAATDVVPWAKPQELPYGPGVPLPSLGSPSTPAGFNVAMADGSVRFINRTIPEADLRSLIEPNDGRQVVIP